MERLTERLQRARSALGRLQEVAGLATPTLLERDAAITRFNFTFELIWKTARSVLIERHGQERPRSGSPKSIIRECRIAGWLTDAQTSAMLKMADDHLAVHVYSEATADMKKPLRSVVMVMRLQAALNMEAKCSEPTPNPPGCNSRL